MTDEILEALGADLRARRDQVEEGDAPAPLLDPLDSGEFDAALAGALDQIDRQAETEAEASDEEAEADVVPLKPRTKRGAPTWAIAGTVLAVAAAVLLWMRLPGPTDGPGPGAMRPAYSLTRMSAGDAVMRSAPSEPAERVELSPDGRVDIVLTPATPIRDAVAVVMVARPTTGTPQLARLSDGVQISDDGAVRLRGPLSRFIALDPGEWTLELLVGDPATLPRDLAALGASADPPPWSTLTVHATISAPG